MVPSTKPNHDSKRQLCLTYSFSIHGRLFSHINPDLSRIVFNLDDVFVRKESPVSSLAVLCHHLLILLVEESDSLGLDSFHDRNYKFNFSRFFINPRNRDKVFVLCDLGKLRPELIEP